MTVSFSSTDDFSDPLGKAREVQDQPSSRAVKYSWDVSREPDPRLQKWQLVGFGGVLNRVLDNMATDACSGSKVFEAGYQSLNRRASRPLRDSGGGQGWLCRSAVGLELGCIWPFTLTSA